MASTDGRSDAAQMLLLTAIVLAMGFIALSSMAARIDQIPEQADRVQQDIIFAEVDLVVDGAAAAMDGFAREEDNATFETRLAAALQHMSLVQSGRGHYVVVGTITCTFDGSDSTVEVPLSIASTEDAVTVTVTRTYNVDLCL